MGMVWWFFYGLGRFYCRDAMNRVSTIKTYNENYLPGECCRAFFTDHGHLDLAGILHLVLYLLRDHE